MNDSQKNIWKGIKLTNNAIKQIIFLFSKYPKVKGIKLGIKKSGCAGFSYTINIIEYPDKNDLKFSYKNINIYIALKCISYIDGTEVDYICDGLNESFKFNHPKFKNFCGCGESFSME